MTVPAAILRDAAHARGSPGRRLLSPIKNDAGDDEHCRPRQHLRERFRGSPFGGFLHAIFSLDLGMTHRCAKALTTARLSTRNTPRRVFALTSPHSANIDRARVEQYYGGNLAQPQPVCAAAMTFFS